MGVKICEHCLKQKIGISIRKEDLIDVFAEKLRNTIGEPFYCEYCGKMLSKVKNINGIEVW